MHKRILSSSIVSVIIFLCTYFPVSADSSGNIPVIVNNKAVAFSAATAYYNGTLLVPAKEYVQALGGKFT